MEVIESFNYHKYTLEESLFGDAEKGISSMPTNSSSGFLFKHLGYPKRSNLWNVSERTVLPQFREEVEWRLKKYKQGDLMASIVVDCYKDETRDIERVLAGKTRIFGVGDAAECPISKMYFGPWLDHLKQHLSSTTMGIGLNAHSYDWTGLGKRVFRHTRRRVIGGDLSTQDISTQTYIGKMFLEVHYRIFGLDKNSEDGRVLKSIVYAIMNSIHVWGQISYYHRKGNSSGQWMTSYFNTWCTHFYEALVWYDECEKLELFFKFREKVSMVIYGDDNLGSVDETIDWFNNLFLARKFKEYFGIEYTDPTKGEIVEPFLSEEDQVFLSRKFVEHNGIYLAPLSFDSLLGMISWVRARTQEDQLKEITSVNISLFLREMYHYQNDMPFVAMWVNKLRKACLNTGINFNVRFDMKEYWTNTMSSYAQTIETCAIGDRLDHL
jgi:hypothetical protein